MKKIFISTLLFFSFAIVALAQPKIEVVGGDTYDWGRINAKSSPAKATLEVKNIGNEDLILKEVKKTCGCTATKVDKDILKPGEKAKIDITMTIAGNKRKTKYITVVTNDPKTPSKRVKITADVYEELYYKPAKYFNLRNLEVGKETISKLSINNNSNKSVTLSSLKSTDPEVELTFIGENGKRTKGSVTISKGSKIELEAKLTPSKAGRINFKAKYETTHPDYKKQSLSGYGKVKESKIFNN